MVITNSLLYMIVADNMSLQTPENREFRKFATTPCPLYKLLTRKTLTRNINVKYESLSDKVKITVATVQHLSLTTDCWMESKTMKTIILSKVLRRLCQLTWVVSL